MLIRNEQPEDRLAVERLNRDAFGRPDEAELIERLRADGAIAFSLVAVAMDRIVGHLVMSWLPTTMDGRDVEALALAPMAVLPKAQRMGVGSKLVAAAVDAARDIGAEAVIVLGHPDFYPRFGFSAKLAQRLDGPFSGDAFMALELRPGALAGERGLVAYPAAFGIASH
ncbi:MAG: N-acetyltransferase [Beijerinckiaceae bacterium]